VKEKVFVSLVVQIGNVKGAVRPFLLEVDRLFSDWFQNHEVILVDNHSTDGSPEEAQSTAPQLKGSFSIISLTRKQPLEIAMFAGADKSMGDYVFEIESPRVDFNLSLLEEMFSKAREGFDVVAAIPSKPVGFLTRGFYGFFNRFSDLDIDLTTERVGLLSRRALNAVLNMREKNRYRKALLGFTGYPKQTVYFEPTSTVWKDERSLFDKVKLATELFVSFSTLGSKLAIFFCLFFLFLSAAIGVYSVYAYYYLPNVYRGWTSIMSFLSLSFAGIFLILATLSEYLRQILGQVQDRPLYIVKAERRVSGTPAF
jgi:polyisoprenyl-phosphate glycosyltransferase